MMRYARWTVIGSAPAGANYNRRVACICDCGTERVVYLASLVKGQSKSCGCLRDELAPQRGVAHGHARKSGRTPEYGAWSGMLSRCYDSKCTSYPRYGARGISVCDRWRFGEAGLTPFECFLADMGARPSPKHSIERVRNGGNYEPKNCQWATPTEQARNTRRNRIVVVNGIRMPLVEAIERFSSVARSTVNSRLHYGWSEEAAIMTPVYGRPVESYKERQRAKAGGGRLEYGAYGASKVIAREDVEQSEVLEADQVLVGINRTRRSFNARLRTLRGFGEPLPMIGDKLVCLRNNRQKKLLNGGLWTVEKVVSKRKGRVKMLCSSEDHVEGQPTEVVVLDQFFTGDEKDIAWEEKKGTDEFTFGYALTCHKSQGSQWDNVYLFDESAAFREDRARWLYTGLTRAAERITVVQ